MNHIKFIFSLNIACTRNENITESITLIDGDTSVNNLPNIEMNNQLNICQTQTNYTDLGEFKVYRGKKNSNDVGRVISFNGETGE